MSMPTLSFCCRGLAWAEFRDCICDYSRLFEAFSWKPLSCPILLWVVFHFITALGSVWFVVKFAQMKVDLSTFQSPPTTVTHVPAPHFSIMVLAHSPVFPTNLCSGSFLVIIMALKSLNSASSTWLATTGKWCWLSWMNWLRGWTDNHRNYKVWHCIFFPVNGAQSSNRCYNLKCGVLEINRLLSRRMWTYLERLQCGVATAKGSKSGLIIG